MLFTHALDDVDAEQAVAEAQRRWGPEGAVSVDDEFLRARMLVGALKGGHFVVYGRGSTWDGAFADAEAREMNASRRRSNR
jgi:hypothetical protein